MALRKSKIYCKAGFRCEFKRSKHSSIRRKHRYFVLCKFEGACNQQANTEIIVKQQEE